MTQKEKQLLMADLCARLLYGVLGVTKDGTVSPLLQRGETEWDIITSIEHSISKYEWRPYLRDLSDMTDEEKEGYFNVCDEDIETLGNAMNAPDIIISDKGRTQGYVAYKELEWLYEHHFDFIRKIGDKYTTLTDLGLALKAPKGMYVNLIK